MTPGWFSGRDSAHAIANELVGDADVILRAQIARGEDFALLDDQETGRASLFTSPRHIFTASHPSEMPRVMTSVREALARGATLVGFLSYDAGAALDALAVNGAGVPDFAGRPPLLWLGEFDEQRQLRFAGGPPRPARTPLKPAVSRTRYETMVKQVLERIRRGDIYQVNLTFPTSLEIESSVDFYCATRGRARAPYGGFLKTSRHHILSFSPELFFRTDGRMIQSRPMKGTRPRDIKINADARLAEELLHSAKDRAENLMIVDLIRNDLSRVCEAGSVKVPRLFDIEAYPTVWQMTSIVTGILREGLTPLDAIMSLFPCGSITGAPKIMASQIIAELEAYNRGIYTGALVYMRTDYAVLSVAIRTIDILERTGRLDVGAGIVADSRPRAEWQECLTKARFATG